MGSSEEQQQQQQQSPVAAAAANDNGHVVEGASQTEATKVGEVAQTKVREHYALEKEPNNGDNVVECEERGVFRKL